MTVNPYGMTRFTGKVALITGGASGIGRATAQRLAAEGAQVIVVDNNAEMGQKTVDGITSEGGSAIFLHGDLADDESIAALALAMRERFVTLDMLVNNAAIHRPGRIEDGGWLNNWEIESRIGFRGWLLLTQHLLPMLKQAGGAIVNVSSEAGFVGRPGQVVYDAIKAAIVSATKTMAQEFADAGIRVNAVAPGWTVTEMHFDRHPDPSARRMELESLSITSCVMKRLAQPSEIAGAIAFLLSDDASYITGTTLHVDGGRVGLSVK
ncbi:glucose 1-dehydrogenase [bacterium]|nr:glucose 1-dehydrogenase [bacterium]